MNNLSHSISLALALALATGGIAASSDAVAASATPAPAVRSAAVAHLDGFSLPVLAYHDVVAAKSDSDEPETVSADTLVRHFSYLQARGFKPVTLAQLHLATSTGTPLPPKSILLTFDDGYASFHQFVLPLLKAFQWPAVLAVVGNRIDSVSAQGPAYLSSAQLRELAASGLVEFANHSFNLHYGLIANAWGNSQPAAVTRAWTTNGVETDEQWRSRVAQDLQRNQQFIASITGKAPTAMVWPYGRYSGELQAVASSVGLQTLFTLEDGVSDIRTDSKGFKRHLVGREDLEGSIAGVLLEQWRKSPVVRVASVRIQDTLPAVGSAQEPKLSAVVAKLADLQGNVAALDPFIRESGIVSGATFETSVLPVGQAYANRVAAVTAGKAGYDTWLSVPLAPSSYRSLTQQQILQLVEDAAKAVPVVGLVVEDTVQVPEAVLLEAVARVAKWRTKPVLALQFKQAEEALAAKASVSHAQYVWLPGSESLTSQIVQSLGGSVILEHDVADQTAARAKLLAGVPNIALSAIPNDVKQWSTLFSLRAVPRVRIETKQGGK